MKTIYYNIVVCEMIGDMITKFNIDTKSNNSLCISTQMCEIVNKQGYMVYTTRINDFIRIYTFSIRTDFDINNCKDIRDEIKEKYKYELRLRKLKQLNNDI